MERRYLTVFVAILVASLVTGLVWNAVLDVSNRGEIRDTIRKTFELAKANKAEEFVELTKLVHSMIYQDYEEEPLAERVRGVTGLYATLCGMAELKSISLTKVLERTNSLAAVTFKGADGKDVTCHMLLLKYEDRSGNKSWVPLEILTIEQDRKKELDALRESAKPETVREQAKQQAQKTVAAPARQVEEQIAQILKKLTPAQETRAELVETLEDIKDLIEVPVLLEKFDAQEAVNVALQKTETLVGQLTVIAEVVESVEVLSTIKQLPKLAEKLPTLKEILKDIEEKMKSAEEPAEEPKEKSAQEKAKEELKKREEAREKLVEQFKQLPGKVRSPELRLAVEEALELLDKGGEKFKEKLKSAAGKAESPQLAGQIGKLVEMAYSSAEKLPDALGAIAKMLKSEKHAGRLKDTKLAEEIDAAKKLTEDKSLNPLSVFEVIDSPKSQYLRLVARLDAIGKAQKPEDEKGRVLGVMGQISGGLKKAGALWVRLKTPGIRRYLAAANKLAQIAPTKELKEETNKLVKAAREAIDKKVEQPDLPDIPPLVERVKGALLEEKRVHAEKFKSLAKLARKTLQDADARSAFAQECDEAAEKPDAKPEEFAGRYAELAAKPVELQTHVADSVSGLVSNRATRDCWSDVFKQKVEDINFDQAVEGITADSLDAGDLYEAREKVLRDALQAERNREGTVRAGMRKRIELLTTSFPEIWAGMKSNEEYMKWAFPVDKATGKAREVSLTVVKNQERLAGVVVGKKVVVTVTHHWYPDPESGFQRDDTRRTSEIVRVRFQTNPGAERGSEEYDVSDFMLLQEMSEDWSVKWELYRACDLSEDDKCLEIANEEFEKRKAYFADGKAR